MLNYDMRLMEKSIAEGWIDNCYKDKDEVKLICEERGLSFPSVEYYFNEEKDNE